MAGGDHVCVQVAGVTFAALWADVLEARCSGDVGALLFGSVRRREDAVLQDEQDQAQVEARTTVVLQTAALLDGTQALLDATGEVDHAVASQLVNALRPAGQALVGMLVSRRGAPARPSVRDLPLRRRRPGTDEGVGAMHRCLICARTTVSGSGRGVRGRQRTRLPLRTLSSACSTSRRPTRGAGR